MALAICLGACSSGMGQWLSNATWETGIATGPMVFMETWVEYPGGGKPLLKDYNIPSTRYTIGAFITCYPQPWLGVRFMTVMEKYMEVTPSPPMQKAGEELSRKNRNPATADKKALCVAQPGGLPLTVAQWAEGARLFAGLGDFHRAVSTSSPQGQAYFDQGMRFLWAFNHDEATRSFAKSAQLDAQCAMCWWGVALTVGPNYNLPIMAEPRAAVAWNALQQAEKYAGQAAPVEQALIGALAKRYQNAQPLDPSNEGPILIAYARTRCMKAVAEQFPDDTDVQVMTAEAMMNINAWKLWTLDGAPAPGTEEILAILEKALAKDPQHPGANHYYIHAVEASPNPGKAVVAAERLPGMMPGPGISNTCRRTSCSGSAVTRLRPRRTARVSPRTSPITPRPSRSTITSCIRPTITNSLFRADGGAPGGNHRSGAPVARYRFQ